MLERLQKKLSFLVLFAERRQVEIPASVSFACLGFIRGVVIAVN